MAKKTKDETYKKIIKEKQHEKDGRAESAVSGKRMCTHNMRLLQLITSAPFSRHTSPHILAIILAFPPNELNKLHYRER